MPHRETSSYVTLNDFENSTMNRVHDQGGHPVVQLSPTQQRLAIVQISNDCLFISICSLSTKKCALNVLANPKETFSEVPKWKGLAGLYWSLFGIGIRPKSFVGQLSWVDYAASVAARSTEGENIPADNINTYITFLNRQFSNVHSAMSRSGARKDLGAVKEFR